MNWYMFLPWLRWTVVIALVWTWSSGALAGSDSDEFATVVTQLEGWAIGGLGRAISLTAVIVGALVSVVRSNPLPILSGIAFAIILNFTPGIVTGLLTGTV